MNVILVHCGHASFDNGAIAPINKMYDIAKLADGHVISGEYYGDDRIEVPAHNFSTVIQLLEESCMLYRLPGDEFKWRGVKEGSAFDEYTKRTERLKK